MKDPQELDNQQMITISAPDKHVHSQYKKKQIFSSISNQNLSNFICLPLCGIFWVGGFLYSNQNKISPIELNFARYLVQLISTIFILKMRKESVDFRDPQDYKMLMIRSVISGLNGMAASFFQMYLPLTVYYTINASLTIFAFLLNYFLYGIQFTMNQVKAVIIALVGIALVINGRAIYHFFDDEYQFQTTFAYSSNDLVVQVFVGFLVVVWSCIWAYGIVITGKHHASFHEFILINTMVGFYMFSAMETMIPQAHSHSMASLFTRKPEQYLETLLYCGVPLATANYIFNAGVFISTNTGVSTMLTQINILYVYFISTIRYHQSINFICLLGAILIIGSIYATLFRK